jgi:hypothetical protein
LNPKVIAVAVDMSVTKLTLHYVWNYPLRRVTLQLSIKLILYSFLQVVDDPHEIIGELWHDRGMGKFLFWKINVAD